jgi:hypothetical protein
MRSDYATLSAYKVVDFNRSGPAIEIEADSDAEAMGKSEQYVDGGEILLSEGARFVVTLKSKKPTAEIAKFPKT